MSNPNIAEMDIIQILESVFKSEIPQSSGSSEKMMQEEGYNLRSVIGSPYSRSLFDAVLLLTTHISGLSSTQHQELHENSDEKLQETECEVFRNKFLRLRIRKEVLEKLFWQAIMEEFPQAAVNNVDIRDGWLLVDTGHREWDETILVRDTSALANIFVDRLKGIFSGEYEAVGSEDLAPAAPGEEEIGRISDRRIQILRSILNETRNELGRQLPEGVTFNHGEVSGSVAPEDLNFLLKLVTHYSGLIELVRSLLWCMVYDNVVPVDLGLPHVVIRDGWRIVKCDPNKNFVRITVE